MRANVLIGLYMSVSVAIFSFVFIPASFASPDAIKAMKERIGDVISLKESGQIGEKQNGLLGAIKDSAEVRQVIDAENADRMKVYEARAKDQGQDVEVLQKVLGAARIRDEKPGRFVENEAGKWEMVKEKK